MQTPSPDTRPSRRRLAWGVPLLVGVVVAGTAVVVNGGAAGATPVLPARTADQLLTGVLSSTTTALSGTVTQTSNLGLPSLPGGNGDASLSWQQLLTGTNTVRVWVDGPQRQRIAVQGQLSEADVVHDGPDVWTYVSHTNTVSHTTLPTDDASTDQTPTAMTPASAAAQVLTAVDPTTAVSVADNQTVAGRSAYTLVLQPRDTRTTIRQVTVAVDAATSVPLRLDVYGAAAKPAFEVGFTSVSFDTPAASTFAFTPPAGATVTTTPLAGGAGRPSTPPATSPRAGVSARPTVTGTGWTSIVELPAGPDATTTSGGLLDELTTSLPSGARLLHTALINAVLLPDGRVFVGAVGQQLLEQAAAH